MDAQNIRINRLAAPVHPLFRALVAREGRASCLQEQIVRLHIISDVYPPEPVTSAGIASDIAEEMNRRGHDITVFAPFPNRPSGNVLPLHGRSWRTVENRSGYRIIHSWHTLSKRSIWLSRMAENISFGLTSTLQLLREPVPDVVYMNTWPLFAQLMNAYTLSRRRVPVICAIKDLYPESFLGTGFMSRDNMLFRLGIRIDNQVYKNSALIAPLNTAMADYLVTTRGIPAHKVKVLHDWVDASLFPADPQKHNAFRQQHDLTDDLFVATYAGSMTRMAGLELYVQAAEKLRHRQDIRILLVGDGAMREDIESMIQQKGLHNIRMIYPLTPDEVPQVQAASDVLMLSLLPGVAEHATPSKLIFYLFSQRPVLACVKDDGPPARLIQDAECGAVLPQNDSEALAKQLEQFANQRSALSALGKNARHYAEEHFMKENVLPRVCDLIEETGRKRT